MSSPTQQQRTEICHCMRTRSKSICRLGVGSVTFVCETKLSCDPNEQQMKCCGANKKSDFGSKRRVLKVIFVVLSNLDGETPITLQPTNVTEKTQLIGDSHRSYHTES